MKTLRLLLLSLVAALPALAADQLTVGAPEVVSGDSDRSHDL